MTVRALRENRRPVIRLHRALLLCLLAAVLLAAGTAGARTASPSPLTPKLARALAVAGLDGSRSGAVAIDLATGEVLFKRRRYVGLEPASNEKLPVTFAALHVLGGAFRISTDVLGDGGQAGKVWRGNLVLVGHGDPSLSSQDLKRLAWLVRGTGIRRVTGSIVGDESYFDSKRGVWGWKSYFYGGESPPLSALAVDRCVYQGRLAIRPAVAAAALFRKALIAAGVKVAGRSRQGRATEGSVPLARVSSKPLWKILRFMDSWSDNFTAELVLKQLGAREGHGTSAGGAAVVRRVLSESSVPMSGVRIVDGSGLSTKDRLTVAALVAILSSAWSDPTLRKPFQSVLAVAGRTGTLRNRLLGISTRGRVLAKTGTTNEASALAGYVKGRYAFAIIHNGYPLASWYAKQAEDRFVQVLAAAK
jgi:D-alanyl-D-alanine carboxypeptidase/D-alanyl-D-alanine-endopeptidase (penicillin-binding protein 4)